MRCIAKPTLTRFPRVLACAAAVWFGLSAQTVSAQSSGPQDAPTPADTKPAQLQGVDMDYHLGAKVSPELVFTDSNGQRVKLGDYLDGERPVVLQLGYYECPMLCGLVFQGLHKVIGETSLVLGDDYRVITVSIDPAERPSLAKAKQQTLTKDMKIADGTEGWHFMVGESHMIQRLADEVGFGFRWVREQRQFAHPAVIMILAPDGTITRYLSGIDYKEQTFRMSLVEASQGQVGSLTDQFLLTCLHYDPALGTYSMTAMGIMRIGGALTVIVLIVVIGAFLWRDHRRRVRTQTHPAAHAAAHQG